MSVIDETRALHSVVYFPQQRTQCRLPQCTLCCPEGEPRLVLLTPANGCPPPGARRRPPPGWLAPPPPVLVDYAPLLAEAEEGPLGGGAARHDALVRMALH
eukprot:5279492-Pyramimonas_sp.AAC.1